jgi:N-acetylglutamate synthase-like GNAT family acetyltransferase
MTEIDVAIRRAREEDAQAIAMLTKELGYEATPDQIHTRLTAFSGDDHAVLVAESVEGVIGWMHVAATLLLESGALAEIRGLVVTENRRSSGVGAQLVRAAEEWAASRGIERLRVRTNVTRERAHRFYERGGFHLLKEQRVYEKALSPSVLDSA